MVTVWICASSPSLATRDVRARALYLDVLNSYGLMYRALFRIHTQPCDSPVQCLQESDRASAQVVGRKPAMNLDDKTSSNDQLIHG